MIGENNHYIDIHSHILPGVDDGARDIEETREMLTLAYKEGIRTIIATPHFQLRSNTKPSLLYEQLELVQKEAWNIDHNFQIYLGNEIYYEDGCLEAVQAQKALTMAGSRYVLIEFSPDESYKKLYKAMQDFILSGYIPIIAHIERYACLRKKKDRLEELTKLGCYMQINADSLTGGFLDFEAAYLRKLIAENWVHFIATDSHDPKERAPRLTDALNKLEKSLEEEDIKTLLFKNPSKIIENKYI